MPHLIGYLLVIIVVLVVLSMLWMIVVPFRLRLAVTAAACSFLVVWKAWRLDRVVSWTMRVGPERAGFESFFGIYVVADNVKTRVPKFGEKLNADDNKTQRTDQ